ncbi:MAG: hypothetical protein KIT34_13460 [Cyanobacteria bacterium TGS_CYA1]|nr:hypothetical protein [Cyanobacteria bacterium TGS_CYA1]
MKTLRISKITVLFLALLFSLSNAEAQEKTDGDECCKPGRVESAKEIIDQSKNFKLNATETNIRLKDAIQRARMLKGETNKLTGELEKGHVDAYNKNLAAFMEHADKYKAHLLKTEQDYGHCKASEAAYKTQLSAWKSHIDSYHIRIPNFNLGDLRPPRACPAMNTSVQESDNLVNSMRTDTQRLITSQRELQVAQARLANALQANSGQDVQVLNRSKLLEAERQLAGEFASLKTELELLNTQYKAIAKTSDPKGTVTISKVSGSIKSQKSKP